MQKLACGNSGSMIPCKSASGTTLGNVQLSMQKKKKKYYIFFFFALLTVSVLLHLPEMEGFRRSVTIILNFLKLYVSECVHFPSPGWWGVVMSPSFTSPCEFMDHCSVHALSIIHASASLRLITLPSIQRFRIQYGY